MDEPKMISVEKMDEIIKDYYPDTITFDWHGQDLVIRKTITFSEMQALVKTVSTKCFDASNGEYLSELRDFLTDMLVVAFYTNVRMPQNVEKQYRMLRQTELTKLVYDNISDDQVSEFTRAISARINLHNEQNTKLIEKQIQDASASITAIADLLGEMFDGIDKDDIANIAKAVGDGGIDMEKLVGTVVAKQAEQNKAAEPLHDEEADGK